VSAVVRVRRLSPVDVHIALIDSSGSVVFEDGQSGTITQLPTTFLPRGTYYLKLSYYSKVKQVWHQKRVI
jgi:hypothetical protein